MRSWNGRATPEGWIRNRSRPCEGPWSSPAATTIRHICKAHSDPSRHEADIKSFKLPFGGEDAGVRGDTGVLIVNNMLLTGFDAPIEQVMYLDRVVVAHNLSCTSSRT